MNKEKLRSDVIEISKFKHNWDSYGAESFTKEIINEVNVVIDCLDDKFPESCIVPSCVGIQLEWDNGEKALEISVEDDDVLYLKVIGEDVENWIEGQISDYDEINEMLGWLYEE